jgi:Zn-dependent peptidase ImmA (M78 family)
VSTFRRGFKSWCETTSAQFRTVLGLSAADVLPAKQLADHIGVIVVDVREVPGLSAKSLRQLTEKDRESWSAMLVRHANHRVVVMNTSHSTGRQSSSLMHECAHVILNHEPEEAGHVAGGILMVSGYRPQQEAEADWLAGTLLLPRVALLSIVQLGMSRQDAANLYGVSDDMLRMRLDLTGVNIQMRESNI